MSALPALSIRKLPPRHAAPRILSRVASCLLLAALTPALFSQSSRDAEDAAAGCAACSMLLAVPAVIIGILVLHVVLFIWVARDAKARGMDNAALWVIIVMIGGVIGLIVYIYSRPQGNIVPCPNCSNKRLQASVKCPHCAAA